MKMAWSLITSSSSIYILAAWVPLLLTVHAAPSIEACPPDSILSTDTCKCNLDACTKPPCPSTLIQTTTVTDIPGACCPKYSCIDCTNDTMIDGVCPCADGAVINAAGICECVDHEKRLIDGRCECDPEACELPLLCDRKSVLITVEEGCCKKTKCKACPEDSESTNLESDDLEDHCVCLPCKNECEYNKTLVIKKRGTGFPGNCCDFYECVSPTTLEENDKDCIVGDIIYANGDEWSTSDRQKCRCQNGLSLCSKIQEEKSQTCYIDGRLYKHNETWIKEDGCTNCTCINGEDKCISHYCFFKETQIDEQNSSKPCFKENKIYQHLDTWVAEDSCSSCTCLNAEENCDSTLCSDKDKNECQPLISCNKICANGFRINKKGCEICKCNVPKISYEILQKYNITMSELIRILEEFRKGRRSGATSTTEANVELMLESGNSTTDEIVTSSTTVEPSVVTADNHTLHGDEWPTIIAVVVVLLFFSIVILIVACCFVKKRKCQSMDLTNCHYKTVEGHINNNNHIEKTADPLIKK